MPKNTVAFFSFLLLVVAVLFSLYAEKPFKFTQQDTDVTKFNVSRAFKHVQEIAQKPHYVGSEAHGQVQRYLMEELEKLGLQVQIQEGWALSNRGTLVKVKNILARKQASNNSLEENSTLLLLSHYDSAIHSSFGASDAASGVATILEGVRAFLAAKTTHANDILVAFTDAEEIGLNGASLLLEHPWAKEVNLALNFEARGSGGSSFMLLETNYGNQEMISQFMQAGVKYPVANSLTYSIYKWLPNDTDLTVLREQQGINGFNFAFIGDHFDYHTATDTPENLDIKSLAHQGSYLMPLLYYFSDHPLDKLTSEDDSVYFTIPLLGMIQYPAKWSLPLLIIASVLFLFVVLYGASKKKFFLQDLLEGIIPFLISLLLSAIVAFLLWELSQLFYPHYKEIEHDFTYNGYYYIWAIVMATIGVCFFTYNNFYNSTSSSPATTFVAPLLFWLILSGTVVFFLEGAAYFIILVYFGLIQLLLLLRDRKPSLIMMSFLCLPAIFLLLPLVVNIPVAMGLKSLYVTAILVVLFWSLMWPVIGYYSKNNHLGFLSLIVAAILLLIAHFKSDFNLERPKPNSLVYLQDLDKGSATWNTYDYGLDSWTTPYFPDAKVTEDIEASFSNKYNSGFTRSAEAPNLKLKSSKVLIQVGQSDSSGLLLFQIEIIPQRNVDQIELYTKGISNFDTFRVNGQTAPSLSTAHGPGHIFTNRWSNRLLTYYVTGPDTLQLEFSLKRSLSPYIEMYETSYDLLENEQLDVPARAEAMIPRPFVLTDGIVLRKKIELPLISSQHNDNEE